MAIVKTPFYPGRAVTAEFLNASQYLGPSNPGIVFVANPTNFWEYPLLSTTSIDIGDFDGRYIVRNGNSVINGTKFFTTSPEVPLLPLADNSPKVASTAFVQQELANLIATSGFVDIPSIQVITGFKTFQNIAVPLNPGFANSPVSFQWANTNVVQLNGAQNVAGVKTFNNSPEVPTPTTAPQATPKSYVDGLVSAVQTIVTGLQTAVSALQAVITGLTFSSGTYPGASGSISYFYLVFPNNLKILWAKDAGSVTQAEVISFPTTAQGFPGFASPPIVFCQGLGTSSQRFQPEINSVTAAGFSKAQENFGGGPGTKLNYLAFGV